MADTAITLKTPRGQMVEVLRFVNIAAITTGTDKWRWTVTRHSRITDIIVDSITAGSGGTSDIIDIHLNGTTIYTTQANRPTLLQADTGLWTEAGEPEITVLVPGDVLTVDIDQISTTGSALVEVCVITVAR